MRIGIVLALFGALLAQTDLFAQTDPIAITLLDVDAGNTKPTGSIFSYRLTYRCLVTAGCNSAQLVDLLPTRVDAPSTVPSSPG